MTLPSVMLGMPEDHGTLPVQTVNSLIGTLFACAKSGVACELSIISGNSVVHLARSEVGYKFLASQAERLFMIDSDIAWRPQDFLRMLELSRHMDVICAAYPQKKDPPEFMLGSIPDKPNEHGCHEIEGLGLGFVVVHRRVMEALAEKSPKRMYRGKLQPYLFKGDVVRDNVVRSEDFAFFDEVREMGFKVWLDPRTVLGHIGPKVYVGDIQAAIGAKPC
jgi:hypothetical protein